MRRPSAALIGLILIGAALLFAGGTEYTIHRDSRWAASLLALPAVSAQARANASYHLAHAERRRDTRWHLTGHGTLGVIAASIGIAAIAGTWRQRSARRDG